MHDRWCGTLTAKIFCPYPTPSLHINRDSEKSSALPAGCVEQKPTPPHLAGPSRNPNLDVVPWIQGVVGFGPKAERLPA
jgi:hypothetical protein